MINKKGLDYNEVLQEFKSAIDGNENANIDDDNGKLADFSQAQNGDSTTEEAAEIWDTKPSLHMMGVLSRAIPLQRRLRIGKEW